VCEWYGPLCVGDDEGLRPCVVAGDSDEKRRTRPPQRLETDDDRNVDCVVVGVTAPDDGPGEESYSGVRER